MIDIKKEYEKVCDVKDIQKIYSKTNILPTKKVFLHILWDCYDRLEIIKFFEGKIPIDIDIMNQIPCHSEHSHIASGFCHEICDKSLEILKYLYEKYHIACDNKGLLNACHCADLPSSKYIIETMKIVPNSTHIEQLCENCLDIGLLKYLHNDLDVVITKKAICNIKENENNRFIEYLKKLQLIDESSDESSDS